MCRLYPVTVYWSWELASVWNCYILPHLYQMLLKENPQSPLHPQPIAVWIMKSPIPLGCSPGIKKTTVSITMRTNEGPRLRWLMWCPCPSSTHQAPSLLSASSPHSVTHMVLYPPALQPITHCHAVIRCERKWKFECKVTFLFTCCSIFRSCGLTLEHTVLKCSPGTLTCKTIRGFSWLCTPSLISNFNSHMLL